MKNHDDHNSPERQNRRRATACKLVPSNRGERGPKCSSRELGTSLPAVARRDAKCEHDREHDRDRDRDRDHDHDHDPAGSMVLDETPLALLRDVVVPATLWYCARAASSHFRAQGRRNPA